MSSKKISGYSRDFKLKVLEYYFKHGGDKKFGLRAKTAHHFRIDHKTVSRMLCNPEIVKKARRALTNKNSSAGCKPSKPPSLKPISVVGVDTKAVESEVDECFSPGPSKAYSSQNRNVSSQQRTQLSTEVPVIELPEDPDYSVLKRTIESSASASSNFARLLITGTPEVRRLISNECDLIFECKVCRNLFRSVVNFLAHKRVYCQENYSNVKSLFRKDSGLNMTNESSTVIVEPKSPPSEVSSESTSNLQPNKCELKIDQIASRLAKSQKKSKGCEEVSSSTHSGSSAYYDNLHKVNELRKSMKTNCSVLLQDIAGIPSAVYQSFIPPKCNKLPVENKQEVPRKVHPRKRAQPVQLDSEGKVMKKKEAKVSPSVASSKTPPAVVKEPEDERIFPCSSCSSEFCSKSLLHCHVEEVHGLERSVYTCPICNMIFLTIWGCVKHLIRIHKKKKHQRERLKHVICSRAYSKLFTRKEIAKLTHKSYTPLAPVAEKKPETPTTVAGSPSKELPVDSIASRVQLPTQDESSSLNRHKVSSLPRSCPRCAQSFSSPSAMGSHQQFCPLVSLPTNLQAETPEKKIAIQIRKDYKKEVVGPSSSPIPVMQDKWKFEDKTSLEIQTRIKEICNIDQLLCNPCKKRYNTITVLKRHVAHHLGWTRFVCKRCSFRSYDKYICTQHCLTMHRVGGKGLDQMVLKEEKLGSFRYYLTVSKGLCQGILSPRIDLEDNDQKSEYLQNGDCSSPSECGASIISEDSSFKGEFENQDLETANVAYRELIENVDLGVDVKEPKTNQDKESKGNPDIKEPEFRAERPQRMRKAVEQKDFVYEMVRSSTSASRSEEDGKIVSGMPMRHRSVPQDYISNAERSSKRKGSPLAKEPNKKVNESMTSSPNLDSSLKICNGRKSPLIESSSSIVSLPKLENEIKIEFPEFESVEISQDSGNSSCRKYDSSEEALTVAIIPKEEALSPVHETVELVENSLEMEIALQVPDEMVIPKEEVEEEEEEKREVSPPQPVVPTPNIKLCDSRPKLFLSEEARKPFSMDTAESRQATD